MRNLRFLPVLLALGTLLALLVVTGSTPAHAATFTVTNTADSGVGSLRQAILDANALVGADTINLPAGTYTLSYRGLRL